MRICPYGLFLLILQPNCTKRLENNDFSRRIEGGIWREAAFSRC